MYTRYPEEIPSDEGLGSEEDDTVDLGDDDEESLEEDDETNLDVHHNLVGCTLSAYYPDEGGWFDGTVTWYNTRLEKLRVLFLDESDDYIHIEEINGVDIMLKTCKSYCLFYLSHK